MNTKLKTIKLLSSLVLFLAGSSPLVAAEAFRQSTVTPTQPVNGANAFELRCTAAKLAWTKRLPIAVFQKDGHWQQYWSGNDTGQSLSLTLAPAYQVPTLQQLGDKICAERAVAAVRAAPQTTIDCAQAGGIYRASMHHQCEKNLAIAQYEKKQAKRLEVLALLSPNEAKKYLQEQIETVRQQLGKAKTKSEIDRLELELKTLNDKLNVLNLMTDRSLASQQLPWRMS